MAIEFTVKGIIKYGIIAPLYSTILHIIPILVLFGLPIFIAGMIIAIFGVMGHVFFIVLFTFALLYYFRFSYYIIFPKGKKTKVKYNVKKTKKFSTSLGQSRRQARTSYNGYNYLPNYRNRYNYSYRY
jgi:hypothetical protein